MGGIRLKFLYITTQAVRLKYIVITTKFHTLDSWWQQRKNSFSYIKIKELKYYTAKK